MFKVTISFLLVICFTASAVDKTDEIVEMRSSLNGSCDYQLLDSKKRDKHAACVLSALKNRCNTIDDCYSYCFAKDVGNGIGGGCGHLCNYANLNSWAPP